MIGKVHTWFMTPEELAEYVKKHPIIQTDKPKGSSYVEVQDIAGHRKKQEERKLRGNENRWRDM